MDITQSIANGRSHAMENYVDFSGNKRNWLNTYQKDALSPSDKRKYENIAWASDLGVAFAAGIVGYVVRKKGGSNLKTIGFTLGTFLAGYGIAYLATKSYSDKLATKTGVSSNSLEAMKQDSSKTLEKLRNEALASQGISNYGYAY